MLTRVILPVAAIIAGALAASPGRAADYAGSTDVDARPAYARRPIVAVRPAAPSPCLCRPEVRAYPPEPQRRPQVMIETYGRPTPYGGWAYGARALGYGPYGSTSTGFAGYAVVDPYTGAVYRSGFYW